MPQPSVRPKGWWGGGGPRRRPRGDERSRPATRLYWFLDGHNNDANGELIGGRELKVALVVCRHGHHRARPVFHEHKIRDPNGHEFPAIWIARQEARIHALLFARRPRFAAKR